MEVLLIDDQAVTVQVYAAIVRRTFPGARVAVALDLSEGLQIASHRKIDVVLLDLQLQNSVGVQTLNKFRRAAHSLKSNSNTFGALRLGAMARELELGGLPKANENRGQPLDALAEEYSRVAAALTELRHA